jgi:uncharacterized protein YbaR (Trm112 family)
MPDGSWHEWKSFLCCPICHTELVSHDREIICGSGEHVFAVTNGIPVLLPGTEKKLQEKNVDRD